MEHAQPSGSYSGAKQERLSRSPSLLSQQDLRISSNALVCTSWHTTTSRGVHKSCSRLMRT